MFNFLKVLWTHNLVHSTFIYAHQYLDAFALGKQPPDYKATKKALLNFITELARVSKATNPHLANPKAWLF